MDHAEISTVISNSTVNATVVSSTNGVIPWSTTEVPLTLEEEDAIVTLVIIVIGVIAAIIVLFSMGIFIDCKHQKKESMKKRKFKLKMPPLGRRRDLGEGRKSLASDMCPTGVTDIGIHRNDAIV